MHRNNYESFINNQYSNKVYDHFKGNLPEERLNAL